LALAGVLALAGLAFSGLLLQAASKSKQESAAKRAMREKMVFTGN
jgi:hypothetical protein